MTLMGMNPGAGEEDRFGHSESSSIFTSRVGSTRVNL